MKFFILAFAISISAASSAFASDGGQTGRFYGGSGIDGSAGFPRSGSSYGGGRETDTSAGALGRFYGGAGIPGPGCANSYYGNSGGERGPDINVGGVIGN